MGLIQKYIDFFRRDIWRIHSKKLPRSQSLFLRQLRIFLLALRGFDEDKCQLRASALTFYSLLSIVPMVAMAFGIAKGFGLENLLEKLLMERLPGQEEVVGQIIAFARNFLENTKGGLIAGFGVALLFWSVIGVLGNIETSFNDIWGIKKGRTLGRKFSDYLAIMLICPILFITSTSATVLIASQIKMIIQKIALLGVFSPIIYTLLKILPFAVLWILFTYIYIFLPNTNVNFKSGIFGGIIAGTIYQVVQWIYIKFQIGAGNAGAIYGSFAALPLFLYWLRLSWLIVLFGAEISFAEQNVETYEFEPDSHRVKFTFKQLVALRVAQLLTRDFCDGKRPKDASEISQELELPYRLANQVIFDLTEAGVLAEVKVDGKHVPCYHPAVDPHRLTIKTVMDMLVSRGIDDIPVADSRELARIKEAVQAFDKMVQNSPANLALKDI